MEHIVIVGNGISGVTCARHIRKLSNKKITIISAETKYFFSRTALMYVYMGHMKFEHTQPYENDFWEKNKIDLVQDFVSDIDYSKKILNLKDRGTLSYDKLVLAVGSKSNKFGWPGQDLDGVQGMYSAQDLQKLEADSDLIEHGVIVGGGLIGIELAEMLLSRGKKVTFLVREPLFWNNVLPQQESRMITNHIREHHVDLRLETELKEIVPGPNGRVEKIITGSGEEISCEFVGLTAGVTPNVDFLKGSELQIERGIVVNRYLETNIPDVYALGDCAQFSEPAPGRRNLEQVWYTGKFMGEVLANTICGHRKIYDPGHWFNSAKFFDIEYQTYGWVFAKLRDGETDFYWEHKNGKICMHFVYNKESREFLGVNTFGIRLRHQAFDQWLNEKKSIEYVLEHLKDANFDPEFYTQYEEEIVAKFNKENITAISVKQKSWARMLRFLKNSQSNTSKSY